MMKRFKEMVFEATGFGHDPRKPKEIAQEDFDKFMKQWQVSMVNQRPFVHFGKPGEHSINARKEGTDTWVVTVSKNPNTTHDSEIKAKVAAELFRIVNKEFKSMKFKSVKPDKTKLTIRVER
jgi:hypothetical protein